MNNTFDPFLEDSILFSTIGEKNIRTETQMITKFSNLTPLLQSLGLPTFSDSKDQDTCLETSYLIMHSLLRLRQNEINNRNKVEEELFKSRSDNEALKVKISRNNNEADVKSKHLGQQENQLAIINKQCKLLTDKYALEKEELQKQVFKLQQKVSQIQVEVRKKEAECSKFKEQLKRNINDKHQLVRNNFEIIDSITNCKKQDQIYSNLSGWEGWTQVRKQLISENHYQKEMIEKILSVIQRFLMEVQQIEKVNPTGLINVHRAYLNEPVGLVDALKEQLDQLKAHFYPDLINQSICLSSQQEKYTTNVNIENVTILQSSGFSFQENKENDKLKPRPKSQDKTSNKSNHDRNKQTNLSDHRLQFASIQSKINKKKCSQEVRSDLLSDLITDRSTQELNCSFMSRISFKDIPNPEDHIFDSPGFKQKEQTQGSGMKELKKWDFVFKK